MEEVETLKAEREVIEQQLKGPVADISEFYRRHKCASMYVSNVGHTLIEVMCRFSDWSYVCVNRDVVIN